MCIINVTEKMGEKHLSLESFQEIEKYHFKYLFKIANAETKKGKDWVYFIDSSMKQQKFRPYHLWINHHLIDITFQFYFLIHEQTLSQTNFIKSNGQQSISDS